MSTTTELARTVNIYIGIPIFIGGTMGNLLNILFLWKTRRNPCAFIFIVSSLINCVVLFYGLFTRILSVGFALDWAATNDIWCKTRTAFSTASFLMSVTCVCLASIDRFLASCRQEKYRNLSRLSFARWAVVGTILIWFAHSIPELIYVQLVRSPYTGLTTCSAVAPDAFVNYRSYVSLPFYVGVFPAIILCVTGFLTYRNSKTLQIGRQREIIQRQLTTMLLIQIPIILLFTLPYVIFIEYLIFSATTAKTTAQRALESIVTNAVTLLFYIPFATSFLVFFFSSKSFRNEAKRLLRCKNEQVISLGTTQIHPFSTAMVGPTNA